MPHKFHAGRRDKFPKAKYAVTNWSDYNEALRRRGDVTIWLEDGAAGKWFAPKRKGRGGQPKYSDFAIQTQGFVRSLLGLMGVELPVPDFSTLSRRSIGLSVVDDRPQSSGSITLIVDSTCLKIHRGSGWRETKHGTGKTRKSWRKLHIGYDPNSGEIVASLLTTDHVGDETALPELIAVIENKVAHVLADGANDCAGVSNCLTEAFGTDVEITIPPPMTAVLGLSDGRDAHIEHIAEHGRMAWQAATGYNDRALVEAQIGRCKFVIGSELNAREMNRQITENQIATKTLNCMTRLGRAVFKRAA
jgi:hypothetical protein